ncbi:MAG: Calx-beta domain-containing protein, partial [Planctomycetota bacterium]
MCNRILSLVALVLTLSLAGTALAADVKIDLGSGTEMTGWTQWNAADGETRTFDGVDFTISGPPGNYKSRKRNGYGDNFTYDSASFEDDVTGSITLTITNLAAGQYELDAYFNALYSDRQSTVTESLNSTSGTQPFSQDTAGALVLTSTFTSSGPTDVITVDYSVTNSMVFLCGVHLVSTGALVSFESDYSGALETVTPAQIPVVLGNADPGQTYTVDYAVIGGTATGGGVDYTLAPGTLTFPPDSTLEYIDIDIVDDGLGDDDETIIIELSNPTGPSIQLGSPTQHTYTILDPRPTFDFIPAGGSGLESTTPVNVTVTLSAPLAATATVDYAVIGGTATGGGVDYTLNPGTLTFSPDDLTEDITIDIVSDGNDSEPAETIIIELSNPSANAKLGVSQYTYTIMSQMIHLKVDFALVQWDDPNLLWAGSEKPGWWIWASPRWADMYSHDLTWEDGGGSKPTDSGIDGTGIHACVTTGYEGQCGLHVKDLCRDNLAGDGPPYGTVVGDPIANSWLYAVDWAGPEKGDILLLLTDVPAGEYWLYSYHNHWEPCSQSTRNCMQCECGMPAMPSITANPLPTSAPEGYLNYGLPLGSGTGVTQIENAYDVWPTHHLSDDDLVPSLIKFETDGSEVLIIYEADNTFWPDCARPGREGSRGILNAFELVRMEGGPDTSPPTPDPATFASPPAAVSDTEITMTATTGSDASGPVEYYFDETSGNPGGSDSGWVTNSVYNDTGLDPDTQYTYTVQMRDSLANTGTVSAPASATTDPTPDTDPPTPDPATFASPPAAVSSTEITMTATTGSDASGPVEYYFDETSGNPGGSDSGWVTDPVYNDTGLDPDTQYTYTVQMRDSLANTGTASAPASATTDPAPPDTDPPTPNPATFDSAPAAVSSSEITMTATTGSDASGPVEYYFDETSGNPGGSDSGWVTNPVYNDTGLDPDTQYTYTVQMRDSLANTGTASSPASATTQSAAPSVDIKVDFGSGQEMTGWTQWNADDGETRTFDGVDLTIQGPPGNYKSRKRNNYGDNFTYDSASFEDDATGSLTLSITNLAGGDYSLDAYFNALYSDRQVTVTESIDSTSGTQPFSQNIGGALILTSTFTSSGPAEVISVDYSVTNSMPFLCGVQLTSVGGPPPDTDPPTPDPATFASAPAAVSDTEITMTATTGSDASGPVEYYFDETSGNPGGSDSGWTTNPVYTDSGLDPVTQYTYTVQMRDGLLNMGTASSPASATTTDTAPPTPDPATFASPPAAISDTEITMTATTGTDVSGPVEYYFDETSGNPGGSDSGWTTNPVYTDSSLDPVTQYTYTVQMRDSLLNTGTASSPANATTTDTAPPTPDPATFASPPAAVSSSEITMTATTGSDASPPVEYYFDETSGNPGGSDSGWTTNPVYNDTGLQASTQYTYTVQMRDSLANAGTASAPANATTQAGDTDPPTPDPATFDSPPAAVSSSEISMTATTGSDASGPVEYYFDETSGNPGGTDSGWVTNPVYSDTGLDADTQYTYTVQMRDSLANTGTASAPASATTMSAPSVDVKVDFGPGNVMAGWTQWNATSGSKTVDGVDFTLANSGLPLGAKLRSLTGGSSDDLTYDCISSEDPGSGTKTYTLTITNLSNGDYELVTYFNKLYSDWQCTQQVKIDSVLEVGPADAPLQQDTANCLQLTAAFSVTGGTTQVITVDWEEISSNGGPYISGFNLYAAGPAVPAVAFDSDSSSGLETSTPAEVPVSVTNAESGITYTVDYTVTGGTATGGGVDYTLANGTLTFVPGDTSEVISIDIVDDGIEDSGETIEITLSNPTGGTLTLGATTLHTFTITEPGVANLRGASYFRADSDSTARVGPDTDIMVRLGDGDDKLIFRRDQGYLPVWYTELSGEEALTEIVTRSNCETTVNWYSRVRLIEDNPARAIVHWRYAPDCDSLGLTAWVDEYFTVYPDGLCMRTVKNAAGTTFAQWQAAAPDIYSLQLLIDGTSSVPASWLDAPALSITSGSYTDAGYNAERRCYELLCNTTCSPTALDITLDTTGGKLVHNPVIVLWNWGDADADVSVDGQPFSDCYIGYADEMYGDDLVVWLEIESSASVDISITPSGGSGQFADRALPPTHSYAFTDSPPLPLGSSEPGPFGAYYANLQFNDKFDPSYRVGDHADVVVQFDDSTHRFVFWRGTNYQPHWAGDTSETPENPHVGQGIGIAGLPYTCWYGTQFVERRGEDWGLPRYLEPMSDWECRYAHVRIISSNAARAIVQWRYAPCHLDYQCNNDGSDPWGDWVNEYYTVYPDGMSVRWVTAWSRDTGGADMESPHIEFHEAMPITNPGTVPEDNIHWNAVSATDYSGSSYDWTAQDVDGGAMTNLDQITNRPIMVVRMKGSTVPLTVVEGTWVEHDPVGQHSCRPFNAYDDWPAWPDEDRGFKAGPELDWLWNEDPDTHCYRYFWQQYPSHCSMFHMKWDDYEHVEDVRRVKIMLFGMVDATEAANINNMLPLARSWQYAPSLSITSAGFTGGSYDKTERAYKLTRTDPQATTLEFTLSGSSSSPVVNPCIVIADWDNDDATLSIDGQPVTPGSDFRQGIEKGSDEVSSLVVWFTQDTTSSIDVVISEADANDVTPPSPNPATFASAPAAVSSSEITMTATTGSDASPPVEYYFDETSGNPGGSDSGWTTNPVYNDTGLQADTQYTYTVQMRDSLANTGTASAPANATTLPAPDTDPPTPNPATFDSAPAAVSSSEITMTATTGSDASPPVEYYFDETSGNPGGTDSGWTTNPVYNDTGLQADTQYTYTVQMRDSLANTGTASAPANATTLPAPDTDPPTPDPATFDSAPAAVSSSEITMTATTGSDASPPVEYYFDETSGNPGGSDSGWVTNPVYNDTGLQADTQYTYTVQMRDALANTGTASGPASATTQAGPDTTPPSPDPMTWATAPYATGASSIAMVATTATDVSGVEYYFDCTAGGGNDSGWQDSTTYTDTGLMASTQYTYRVQARDKSANQNATGFSTAESATTDAEEPPAPVSILGDAGECGVVQSGWISIGLGTSGGCGTQTNVGGTGIDVTLETGNFGACSCRNLTATGTLA